MGQYIALLPICRQISLFLMKHEGTDSPDNLKYQSRQFMAILHGMMSTCGPAAVCV